MTFQARTIGALSLAAFAAVAACSSTAPTADSSSTQLGEDAGTAPADGGRGARHDASVEVDSGTPFTPAAHPPQSVLPNQGGPILPDPEIVTVTWPGEPLAGDLAAFDAWIGGSAYWTTIASDYGVHAATHPATWVAPTSAPPTLSDAEVQQILLAGIAAGTLRAPTAGSIYTVYPPAGTRVTSFGAAGCQDFQAYHFATKTPGGADVVYAVTPRCAFTQGMTPLAYTTWGSSHEIVEAATDPFYDRPAYRRDDPAKGMPGENADLCTGFPLVIDGHTVTANWSIRAAAADERPCVPATAGPMFGMSAASAEVTVVKGTPTDVKVTLYSNAPMDAFSLLAYAEIDGISTKLSAKSGRNGDEVTLQLTASAATPVGAPSRVYLYALSPDYHTTSSLRVTVK